MSPTAPESTTSKILSIRRMNEEASLRKRYLKIPLRVRLTMWYTLILASALIAFSIFAYITVSNSLNSNLDNVLSEVANSIDAMIFRKVAITRSPTRIMDGFRSDTTSRTKAYPRVTQGNLDSLHVDVRDLSSEDVLDELDKSALLRTRNYYIQIADTSGHVLWRSQNLGSYMLPTYEYLTSGQDTGKIFLNGRFAKTNLRIHTMQTPRAEISIAYSQQEIDEVLSQLSGSFQFGFPIALLLAVAVGYVLALYSLRQVDIITNSAKRITAENLSKRLPLPATNDEIARLTTTLNEMIARLETSFTQVRQFTSDVSHELRTPLAILMGELELALRNEMDEGEYQAIVASALEEVVRLSKMVSSLLEISRAETGQVKLQKTLFDISKMTSEICEDMEILAEDKRISVEQNIQPFVTIIGDQSRLHQMLLNVIDNAVKYTSFGGKVTVSLSTKSSQTKIEISDTGVGISEEDLPQIFNRFFRVDKARSGDVVGNGLGLSIVRWIIEAHRGTIRVKSELGQGTTFTIILPYEGT